jgi:hypothetical protein
MAAGRQSKQPVGTRELPIRKAPSRARLCERACQVVAGVRASHLLRERGDWEEERVCYVEAGARTSPCVRLSLWERRGFDDTGC